MLNVSILGQNCPRARSKHIEKAQSISQQDHTYALVIFAKYPEPGQVKTRLGAVIGMLAAARLYRAFLGDLALRFGQHAEQQGYHLLWACVPSSQPIEAILGEEACIVPQQGATLAERMDNLCHRLREDGYRQAVLLGSDAPQVPTSAVERAFALLNTHDVVLGPAEDGGYYLIGIHLQPEPPDLFRGMQMSTPTVLLETLARARAAHYSVALLDLTFDVDTLADLRKLATLLGNGCPKVAPHTASALQELMTSFPSGEVTTLQPLWDHPMDRLPSGGLSFAHEKEPCWLYRKLAALCCLVEGASRQLPESTLLALLERRRKDHRSWRHLFRSLIPHPRHRTFFSLPRVTRSCTRPAACAQRAERGSRLAMKR
jgi:rSAM/selenodomain-associated transferase 1